MNILSGLYRPDEGEILIDGKPVHFRGAERRDPRRHRHGPPALHAGAGVHGGRERRARRRADRARSTTSTSTRRAQQVRAISAEHGLEVDPDAIIEELPVGLQQRVEIIKVLFRSAERHHLRRADRGADAAGGDRVLRHRPVAARRRQGAGLHHPQAAARCCEVADRISVLRGGKIVGEGDPKTATERRAGRDDGRPAGALQRREAARRSPASRCSR